MSVLSLLKTHCSIPAECYFSFLISRSSASFALFAQMSKSRVVAWHVETGKIPNVLLFLCDDIGFLLEVDILDGYHRSY